MVTTAANGDVHDGGFVLGENAVMLLGQSASGIYLLRGITALVWIDTVKALNASLHKVVQAVNRAERIAARLSRRGTSALSPSQEVLTGTAGAIAAWTADLAAKLAGDGTLSRPVAAGGFGVRLDRFRASGCLTDGGGLPTAEYRAQAVAEEAAEAAEGAERGSPSAALVWLTWKSISSR